MKCAILATGPSMSQELADHIRAQGHGLVVVVSDAFRLAPWADALAAQDHAWWRANADAKKFAGQKFSSNTIAGVQKVRDALTCWSSGVLALEVAAMLGATEIDLHGFDMHGTHYFGPHESIDPKTGKKLKNTTSKRREIFQNQFAQWGRKHHNIQVTNYTPGSKLRAFPCRKKPK